jgi:prophage regulatory protein
MKDRILRPREVVEMTGKSLGTLYRDERDGTFPQHRKIGKRAVGWLESEVEEWMKNIGFSIVTEFENKPIE